jgi:hypothetical protein
MDSAGWGLLLFMRAMIAEDFMHLVGDGTTNLDKFKQSAGYRFDLKQCADPGSRY